MKRLVLAALLAAIPVQALADGTVTQDGNSTRTSQQAALGGGLVRADSTMKAFTMTSTGGISVADEDRDRDKISEWTLISTDSTTGPDSSAAQNVSGYSRFILYVKAWPINHKPDPSTYSNDLRLAVQIRRHLNGGDDSLSTFPIYQYGIGAAGVGTGAVAKGDTLTVGHISAGSATLPWSGEFVVDVDGARSAPANSVAANPFSYPNGISIDLDSLFGREIRAKYLSVRVRIINTNAWKWGGIVTLQGFAQ